MMMILMIKLVSYLEEFIGLDCLNEHPRHGDLILCMSMHKLTSIMYLATIPTFCTQLA